MHKKLHKSVQTSLKDCYYSNDQAKHNKHLTLFEIPGSLYVSALGMLWVC